MQEIILMEDTCMGQGKDFDKEKQSLLSQGYIVLSENIHPAVGKICRLEKKTTN